MSYLTRRQREILRFIREHVDAEGVAPTLQEIASAFGFASTASAQKHIATLQSKGFLRRVKHQKRGLVLSDPERPEGAGMTDIPLLGWVAAGSPIESIPDDERILVPATLLRGGKHYALRVRGDSMIDDGIHDGDVVVVQAANQAREGDAVVALVGGEVTLKRLHREGGGVIRLQPANPDVEPIRVPAAEVRVQGVLVGLVRRY